MSLLHKGCYYTWMSTHTHTPKGTELNLWSIYLCGGSSRLFRAPPWPVFPPFFCSLSSKCSSLSKQQFSGMFRGRHWTTLQGGGERRILVCEYCKNAWISVLDVAYTLWNGSILPCQSMIIAQRHTTSHCNLENVGIRQSNLSAGDKSL